MSMPMCVSMCWLAQPCTHHTPHKVSYSAQDLYSPLDANSHKRIFMCRLALGAHTAVPRGYSDKEPPVRDAERLLGVGELKYDTTTDGNLDRRGMPQVMVAYKDNQAYPEYLVTFSIAAPKKCELSTVT